MVTETYIGKVKSEDFDYAVSCDEKWNTGYSPKPIMYIPDEMNSIYKQIVRDVIDKKENAKQTDWGCFVVKMKKDDLIQYLKKQVENENFLLKIEKLESEAEKEYLLVAKEIY
jgi:hypothetical protein